MSWQDRYIQNLRITTGDAEVFELFTLPSFSKEVEMNGMEYNFVGIGGQLIKKDKENLAGRTFPLEFYFVGEDCLENAKSFEFSALHPDPWTIEHPYYDNILGQVLSLKFDDSQLNVTKVSCIVKETITDNGVRVIRTDPRDIVILKKVELDALFEEVDISPSITEIDTVIATAGAQYQDGVKIITLPEDAEAYFNGFNEAITAVNNAVASPVLAIQALNNFLSLPAQFEANVQDRIRVLGNQIDKLRRTITGLFSPQSKGLYQLQASTLLGAMCEAAVNPQEGNYRNASIAQVISQTISGRFAQFRQDMDSLQGLNGGDPESFIPDFNTMRAVTDLATTTISSLFEIALAGRREFSHILTEDSNVILLTHRFYKLDPNDDNISELIENNGLTYNQIALGIRKGTTIKYYR